jgi:hypothetical protein
MIPIISYHFINLQGIANQQRNVVWPVFEKRFIEKEIKELRQWKLVIEDTIACNWAITFSDKEIWEIKDKTICLYSIE